MEGFGSGLILHGQPNTLMFPPAWSGSLIRFFSRVTPRDPARLNAEVARLQQVFNSGAADLSGGFEEQFGAALSLFCDGMYTARLLRSVPRSRAPRCIGDPLLPVPQYGLCEGDFPGGATNGFFDWQPGLSAHCHESFVILLSQPIASLDESRIEYYREQIGKGARPIIFAASLHDDDDRIILDGHHKFMAYLSFQTLSRRGCW